jgi:hypothetical protein
MNLPLISDILTILDVDEFATQVTYGGSTILAIFDKETVPVDAGGSVEVHQADPKLTCKTADVPSLTEGDAMTINGVPYRAMSWVHDGTGMTEIELEKV